MSAEGSCLLWLSLANIYRGTLRGQLSCPGPALPIPSLRTGPAKLSSQRYHSGVTFLSSKQFVSDILSLAQSLGVQTWQSASEQTLPTADNSVPFRQPQKRHTSQLLVVGLPRSKPERKEKRYFRIINRANILPFYHEQRIYPTAMALQYQDKTGPGKLKHLAEKFFFFFAWPNGGSFTGFLVQTQIYLPGPLEPEVSETDPEKVCASNRTPWENPARREFTHCTFVIYFNTYST